MNDHRQSTRRSHGSLVVVAGGSVTCTLLDVSRTGAMLSTNGRLPDIFYLTLRPGLVRWCQVVWRRGNQVGVKFIPAPKL
ncbi:MAG: PilZ domain-containing protein [Pseudomonadota bacterium]